ncbi:hypothetical protein CNR22_10065 [Sphingobacteriaceae bacterium]|nr:hypothetical protein CNR22_10065 [Sphingobacteriaceae bacterium]
MTKVEACLSNYTLRTKQMGNMFNLQKPWLNYVADFMCKESKLIIEGDGYKPFPEDVIPNHRMWQTRVYTE